MRLICPNCEAKYEVADDAIPDTGRDVQCANCGHAWYQMRARPGASAAVAAAVAEPAAADPAPPHPAVAEIAVAETATPDTATPDTATPDPATPDPALAQTAAPAPDTPALGHAFGDSPDAVAAAATSAPDLPAPDLPAPDLPAPDLPPAPDLAPPPSDSLPGVAADLPVPDAGAPALDPALDPQGLMAVAPEPVPALMQDRDALADPDFGPEPDPEPHDPLAAETAQSAYAVDESVLAILREEAEREANARRAEAAGVETQTDLGLDSMAAARRAAEGEAKPAARRDLLPDVEEINSTLRPSESAADALGGSDLPPPPEPRGGFRSGFLTVMVLATVAAAVYALAPQLGRLVPALEGPLAAFVAFVDGLRLQLDSMMQSATVAINGG